MNKNRYQSGVFIGRFQPFHLGHLYNIEQGLKHCEQMIVIVGSAYRARAVNNPFTYEARKQMMMADLAAVNPSYLDRVQIEPVEDWIYDEQAWIDQVVNVVKKHTLGSVAIVGHEKDHSSYYLKHFPEWGFVEVGNYRDMNATDFRTHYFESKTIDSGFLIPSAEQPEGSESFLKRFLQTESYQQLLEDYQYIQNYKKAWSGTPYPSIFVTADALVICQQHTLLIQRKNSPGKGLWALPGGFIDAHERVQQAIVRELYEETSIDVDAVELQQSLKGVKVFDAPNRSLRGRTITHVGCFQLEGEELPKVTAADDAAEAKWFPLSEFWEMSAQMMDDHYQIVRVLSKQGLV